VGLGPFKEDPRTHETSNISVSYRQIKG
jgi:hypothetical protein